VVRQESRWTLSSVAGRGGGSRGRQENGRKRWTAHNVASIDSILAVVIGCTFVRLNGDSGLVDWFATTTRHRLANGGREVSKHYVTHIYNSAVDFNCSVVVDCIVVWLHLHTYQFSCSCDNDKGWHTQHRRWSAPTWRRRTRRRRTISPRSACA
jgi:hypothetical protein